MSNRTAVIVLCGLGLSSGCDGTDSAPRTCEEGGPVTIRTAPMAEIVVHDDLGVVVDQARADGDGGAEVEVPACGMVTVAWILDGVRGAYLTWTEVAGGDVLTWLSPITDDTANGSVSVSFDTYPGATRYDVSQGCTAFQSNNVDCQQSNGGTSPVAVSVHAIGSPPLASIFATASDGAAPLAYAFTTGIEVGEGATAAIPVWRTDFDRVAVSVTGTPAGATPPTGVSVGLFGDRRSFGWRSSTVAEQGGALTATLDLPKLPATRSITAGFDGPLGPMLIQRAVRGSAVAIDGVALPVIETATSDGEVRPTVTWSTAAPAVVDVAIVKVAFPAQSWYVLAPSSAEQVRVPELPVELAPTEPPFVNPPTVMLLDVDGIGGYGDAIRRVDELATALLRPADFRLSVAGDLDLVLIDR